MKDESFFDEIQKFRVENIPTQHAKLKAALQKGGSSEYVEELPRFVDWAIEQMCDLLFDDKKTDNDEKHKPNEFLLAFSIHSSLHKAEKRQRIIGFSDKVATVDFKPICFYEKMGVDLVKCACSKNYLNTHGPKPDCVKDFLSSRQLPSAWFSLVSQILPKKLDFSVKVPKYPDKNLNKEHKLFLDIWNLKKVMKGHKEVDFSLSSNKKALISERAFQTELKNGLENLIDFKLCNPSIEYLVRCYKSFANSAILQIEENKAALYKNQYSLSNFLDIAMNWLLIGDGSTMTVCYGGLNSSSQPDRCSGILFLYTDEPLKELKKFAISEVAHLFLDTLVSIEDEYHAEKQGKKEGTHEFFHTIKHKLVTAYAFLYDKDEDLSEDELGARACVGQTLLKQLLNHVSTFYKLKTKKDLQKSSFNAEKLVRTHNKYAKLYGDIIGLVLKNGISLPVPKLGALNDISFKMEEDLFDVLFFEVLWNLRQHADFTTPLLIKYDIVETLPNSNAVLNAPQLCLIIENKATIDAFESLANGSIFTDRGKSRLQGLGVVEWIQEHWNCSYWSAEVINKESCTVRFFFPIVSLENKQG
jgi:hypothetical protein